MPSLGIMQGRLSPVRERLQSFPIASWESEFATASRLGFKTLEWVLESDAIEANPLLAEEGRERIRELASHHGVTVQTLCANHFMDHRLHDADRDARSRHAADLVRFLPMAADIGVQTFLIPVLERATLASNADEDALLEALHDPLAVASDLGIRLALETDLTAERTAALLDRAGSPNLGAYYDCGNATAAGFDATGEFEMLGSRVFGVHLKDRKVRGANVPLGTGGVDFPRFFSSIANSDYDGPLVMETTPGDDPVAFAERHIGFVRSFLSLP